MNEIKPQENQKELFSDFVPEPQRNERIPSIAKSHKPILISTTLEQMLLISIVMILVFCLVFFLGVLRGRSMGDQGFAARAAAESPAVRKPVQVKAAVPQAAAKPAAIPGAVNRDGSIMVVREQAKPYTIQILTTKKRAYAESEAASLKSRGINSWVMASNEYYVVCVGTYANKEEARKDLSFFASKYKGSYLRRR